MNKSKVIKITKLYIMFQLIVSFVPIYLMDVKTSKPSPKISQAAEEYFTGKEITSASTEYSDVLIAISNAEEGDVIILPSGNSIWSDPLEMPSGIYLKGSGIQHTKITGGGINVRGENGIPFMISNITFYEGEIEYDYIVVYGSSMDFRITQCSFNFNTFKTGIRIRGYSYGVVDHCKFINSRVLVVEAQAGNDPWKQPLTLGTINAVYVEDCYFYSDVHSNTIDSNGGGRYVFRFNTVINSYCEAHGLQNKDMRGTFSYEIYSNYFTTADNGKDNWVVVSLRGGTGVVFNNTVVNGEGRPYLNFSALYNDRANGNYWQNWGPINGSNPIDGNLPGMNGYPACDQIGRSTDFSNDSIQPQKHEPLYAWNNTFDSFPGLLRTTGEDFSKEIIQEGRDFFNDVPRPDYTPLAYPHPLVSNITNCPDLPEDLEDNSKNSIDLRDIFFISIIIIILIGICSVYGILIKNAYNKHKR